MGHGIIFSAELSIVSFSHLILSDSNRAINHLKSCPVSLFIMCLVNFVCFIVIEVRCEKLFMIIMENNVCNSLNTTNKWNRCLLSWWMGNIDAIIYYDSE